MDMRSVQVPRGCYFRWGAAQGVVREAFTEDLNKDLRGRWSLPRGQLGKVFQTQGTAGAMAQDGCLTRMFEKQPEGTSGQSRWSRQSGERRSERQWRGSVKVLPATIGISAFTEGEGPHQRVLSRRVKWSGLCFNRITVAAVENRLS